MGGLGSQGTRLLQGASGAPEKESGIPGSAIPSARSCRPQGPGHPALLCSAVSA